MSTQQSAAGSANAGSLAEGSRFNRPPVCEEGVCNFCRDHPQGKMMHAERPCNWHPGANHILECQNCADYRKQHRDDPGSQPHTCCIPTEDDKVIVAQRIYASDDPTIPDVVACDGCVAGGFQSTCDVDAQLGFGCTSCGGTRTCTVNGKALDKRPMVFIPYLKWFRHPCDVCFVAAKSVPTTCSWLVDRNNWGQACTVCVENNEITVESSMVVQQPPRPLAVPDSWNLVQKPGGRTIYTRSKGTWRRCCKTCNIIGAICVVDASTPYHACRRCSQLGIDCISMDKKFFPMHDLSRVGFGESMPFQPCTHCVAHGRNCDLQRPCDSCEKHGDDCDAYRKSHARSFNCFPRLDPPPGPLYYLSIGYGPLGVDDDKNGTQLEHWIGPLRPIYGIDKAKDDKFHLSTVPTTRRTGFHPGGAPPHSVDPTSVLATTKPSQFTVELLQTMMQDACAGDVPPAMRPNYQDRVQNLLEIAVNRGGLAYVSPVCRAIVENTPRPSPTETADAFTSSAFRSNAMHAFDLPIRVAEEGPRPRLPARDLESVSALQIPPRPVGGVGSDDYNRVIAPPVPEAEDLDLGSDIPPLDVPQQEEQSPGSPPATGQDGSIDDLDPYIIEGLLAIQRQLRMEEALERTLEQAQVDLENIDLRDFDDDTANNLFIGPVWTANGQLQLPAQPAEPSRWAGASTVQGIDMSHWHQAPIQDAEAPSQSKLFGKLNGAYLRDAPAGDILRDVPLEPAAAAAAAPADGTVELCMEPQAGGRGVCSKLTADRVGCVSAVHAHNNPSNFIVCDDCCDASTNVLIDADIRPITAQDIVSMRAYLCTSCAGHASQSPGNMADFADAGATRVWGRYADGTSHTGVVQLNGGPYAALDPSLRPTLEYYPGVLPATGCACGTKLFDRRLCRFHRLHYAEQALRQVELMQQWRSHAFGRDACPGCLQHRTPADANLSADRTGFLPNERTAWACLVCNDWVVNEANGPDNTPRVVPGLWRNGTVSAQEVFP